MFCLHILGAFDDDDVTHVEGELNPVRDLEIISDELRLKDLEFLNGAIEKMEKNVQRTNDKKLKAEYVSLVEKRKNRTKRKKKLNNTDS